MSERIAIFGTTSGIGRALAAAFAARGARLCLLGRNEDESRRIASDLNVRFGVDARTERFDAEAFDEHAALVGRVIERFGGGLDGAVVCHGAMFDQAEARGRVDLIRRTYDVNLTSAASVLEPIAAHMAERGEGWIAGVSSVAGDRGRQSNYLYGSAKAGLTAYLAGLRNRMHGHGVRVVTVKPGFVDTPMTHGLVDPDSPLVASPERVARDIDRAIRGRRSTVYTPWFWRGVMAIIRNIPEAVFKRLKL